MKRPPVLRYEPNFPGKATHLAEPAGVGGIAHRAACGLLNVAALTTHEPSVNCKRCQRTLRRRRRFRR